MPAAMASAKASSTSSAAASALPSQTVNVNTKPMRPALLHASLARQEDRATAVLPRERINLRSTPPDRP